MMNGAAGSLPLKASHGWAGPRRSAEHTAAGLRAGDSAGTRPVNSGPCRSTPTEESSSR